HDIYTPSLHDALPILSPFYLLSKIISEPSLNENAICQNNQRYQCVLVHENHTCRMSGNVWSLDISYILFFYDCDRIAYARIPSDDSERRTVNFPDGFINNRLEVYIFINQYRIVRFSWIEKCFMGFEAIGLPNRDIFDKIGRAHV